MRLLASRRTRGGGISVFTAVVLMLRQLLTDAQSSENRREVNLQVQKQKNARFYWRFSQFGPGQKEVKIRSSFVVGISIINRALTVDSAGF